MTKGRKRKPGPYYGAGKKARKAWSAWTESKTDIFLDRWDFDDYPEEEAKTSADIMADLLSRRDRPRKKLSEELSYLVKAQRVAFFETGNPWFAVEAFSLLVADNSDVPRWVLEPLAKGFRKALDDRECDLRDALGLSVEGWDKTKGLVHQVPIMMDIYRLVNEFGLSENKAAQACELKKKAHNHKTYLRWYRNFWRGIIRTLYPAYKPMSEFKRTRFIQSFPPEARRLLVKKRRTK